MRARVNECVGVSAGVSVTVRSPSSVLARGQSPTAAPTLGPARGCSSQGVGGGGAAAASQARPVRPACYLQPQASTTMSSYCL